MSLRFGVDWIGTTTRKIVARHYPKNASITDLYSIPSVPYMDRFGQYTKVPRMKSLGY